MIKYIQLFSILLLLSYSIGMAQDTDSVPLNNIAASVGYYQTIDLDADTPCNCDVKTERTHDLNKGLLPYDVINYKLHAYTFTFGNSSVPAAKLFKALENDATVYKVSMKEWESFMLLTTDKFDVASFEQAAAKAFYMFSGIQPEDFLKRKNATSYQEYIQQLEYERQQKELQLKSAEGQK